MTINQAFQSLRTNLELKPTLDQLAQQRHTAIRSVIDNSNLLVLNTKIIGSYQRKTRIHPLDDSEVDIDILVVVGEFAQWVTSGGITAQQAMTNLHQTVISSPRYQNMNPVIDNPVVTLGSETRIKVELVPAYIDKIGHNPNYEPHSPVGRAYWIPDPVSGTGWILGDYDYDADYISAVNQKTGGFLIPTIKMLKALKRSYFPNLDSYPLEVLAAESVQTTYLVSQMIAAPVTYPALIRDFFSQSSPQLFLPIKMPDSLTPSVQLSQLEAVDLQTKFSSLHYHVSSLIGLGETSEAWAGWKQLFGSGFPERSL